MHTISSYRGNRHTNKHTNAATNPHTGPITIHCAAKLSAQCNYQHSQQSKRWPCEHCFDQNSLTALHLSVFVIYMCGRWCDKNARFVRHCVDRHRTFSGTLAGAFFCSSVAASVLVFGSADGSWFQHKQQSRQRWQ